MPLIITSVDLDNGEVYYFYSKNNTDKRIQISDKIKTIENIEVSKAIRASCSFPLVFEPCKYNNIELIDGGIRENTPWKETKNQGADIVISVVFKKELSRKNCKNAVDVVHKSLLIMQHELENYELEGADFILSIPTEEISLLDVSKIDELYWLGYKIAKQNIEKIKEKINKKNKL